MTLSRLLRFCGLAAVLATSVYAHGDHHQQEPLAAGASWAERHMAEEHHIGNFDSASFFSLHDYDSDGFWTAAEVLRTYGLEDESSKDVPESKRNEVAHTIMQLMDLDENGLISREEWSKFCRDGKKLPDFGLGPGHHGDDEYEYEIHHFEKYHDENTKEEDLTHLEDIAHFKKHDKEAAEEEEQAKLDAMAVVEKNIPQKFRKTD